MLSSATRATPAWVGTYFGLNTYHNAGKEQALHAGNHRPSKALICYCKVYNVGSISSKTSLTLGLDFGLTTTIVSCVP